LLAAEYENSDLLLSPQAASPKTPKHSKNPVPTSELWMLRILFPLFNGHELTGYQ